MMRQAFRDTLEKVRSRLWLILAGAICVWGPTTLISLLTQRPLNPIVGLMVPPLGFVLGYFYLRRLRGKERLSISVWMLFGVFALGTFFLSIALIPQGGRFDINLIAFSVFLLWPTIEFAGGQGSGLGLVVTAILAAILQFIFERKGRKRGTPQAEAG